MLRALALLCLLAHLPGCIGSGTRGVTLRVTTDDGAPVANAQIYAVVLGRSPVPVPVGLDTIGEILTKETISGWTDASGEVVLDLAKDESHVVFLRPPPLGPYAPEPGEAGEAGAVRYLLVKGKDGLSADPVSSSEPTTLRLETVR